MGTGPGRRTAEVLVLSSLLGTPFVDFNDDGQVDFGESGIANVLITLAGTDDLGNTVSQSQMTDSDGAYVFLNLRPGTYSITEAQPAGYARGTDSVGTAGGTLTATDQFLVNLAPDANGLNYNYGERPAATGAVQKGQTAGIGFWNNRNGQALILALNGGGTSHQLGDWLATTFVNLYGANSGNDLAGQSNASVAALFQQHFLDSRPKLDAQCWRRQRGPAAGHGRSGYRRTAVQRQRDQEERGERRLQRPQPGGERRLSSEDRGPGAGARRPAPGRSVREGTTSSTYPAVAVAGPLHGIS
jgi:hypothetical protein